ncbi:MAG: 4-(cytidine 5'-diphospho)-2-C-methyl-D-erythritol kinase [Nitrospirae bacterium]|nr:4-(cytidine 5'-diphospho)-2-C-methyl-D-erythritol kinase [Nitrospirota bacterium]
MARHSALSLKAPAKINWFLNILGLRDDGFHEIQTLIQKITFYDALTFTPSKDLTLKTDASIPVERNLVYKAALLLKNTYGVKEGAVIQLDKNIPAGAGLGGGSSDAAAALQGLNKLWSLNLAAAALCKIGEQLGSDVPFFLHGPLCLAGGRGEKIIPFKPGKTSSILLVKPPFDISTAWAYGEYRKDNRSPLTVDRPTVNGQRSTVKPELTKKADKVDNIEFLVRKLERAEFKDLMTTVSNDLEPVVIKSFPVIAEIKDRLLEQGAVFSLMSGSGSTVYGVFNSAEDAGNASAAFNGCRTVVVQTITD